MNKIIKFVKKNIMILIAIVVIFILFQKKESFSNMNVKVYGASWCGYTNQQLKHFKDNNVKVDYFDCEENEEICKNEGIDTFPINFVDGKKHIGFTKFFDDNGNRLPLQ